ncbi:MAG: hypothetical protein AcusKO_47710 [Acuticoccus sp.]
MTALRFTAFASYNFNDASDGTFFVDGPSVVTEIFGSDLMTAPGGGDSFVSGDPVSFELVDNAGADPVSYNGVYLGQAFGVGGTYFVVSVEPGVNSTGDLNGTTGPGQSQVFVFTTDPAPSTGDFVSFGLPLVGETDVGAPTVDAEIAFTYGEGSADEDVLGTVDATDSDGIASFQITSGNDSNYFEIDSATGAISLTSAGVGSEANDFGVGLDSFAVSVAITDGLGNVAETQVELTVGDGEAPVVNQAQFDLQYLGQGGAGSFIGIVGATDNVGVVEYEVLGADAEFFSINAGGAVFITADATQYPEYYDFFTQPNSFSFDFVAIDAAGNRSAAATANAFLFPNDSSPPQFEAPVPDIFYQENQAAGDTIATVQAVDDIVVADYRLEFDVPEFESYYAIDNLGNISLTASGVASAFNDFEQVPNFVFGRVYAIDGAGNESDPGFLTFYVEDDPLDVDASAPSPHGPISTFDISADSEVGDIVQTLRVRDYFDVSEIIFQTSDQDDLFSFSEFRFSEQIGDLKIFEVDVILDVDASELQTGFSSFGYQLSDSAGNQSPIYNQSYQVKSSDVIAPFVISDQEFTYSEGIQFNEVIGTLLAADDVGVVNYTVAGEHAAAFFIDPLTANIHFFSNEFSQYGDLEIGLNSFELLVTAYDAAGNASSAETVTMTLAGDETPPTIPAGQVFDFTENQAAHTNIGTIVGSDETGIAEFEVVGGTGASNFYVRAFDGAIFLSAPGSTSDANDFESGDNTFTLDVIAYDEAGNVSEGATVTINVENDPTDDEAILGVVLSQKANPATEIDRFATFPEALASVEDGQFIDVLPVASIGDVGSHLVGDNDITIRGNASFDGVFTLADGVSRILLKGDTNADIIGNSARNILRGSDGDNTLTGVAGRNTFFGGEGADALVGGSDTDLANYGKSDEAVTINLMTGTGAGGEAEGDTFSGIESIKGSDFDDNITGDAARNILRGGTGDDVLSGGEGNDILLGEQGADQLNGGIGRDLAKYAGSEAAVQIDLDAGAGSGGSAEGDTFNGIESILGSRFGDDISGDDARNVLRAGGGDDTVNGGGNNDKLFGGDGADEFRFASAGFGHDVIGDFEDGVDLIDTTSFGATLADFDIAEVAGDTVLTLLSDPTSSITLIGISEISISDDDFAII